MAVEIYTLAVSLAIFYILKYSDAAIVPLDENYTATLGNDFTIPWTYDNEADMETVFWTYKSSSSATPTTIMSKTGAADAQVFNNYNVEHVSNGNITLKTVTMDNAGIFLCAVDYTFLSGHTAVTGTATLSVTTESTTTTTTTSSSSSTSTTTSTTTTSTTTTSTPTTLTTATASATSSATSSATKAKSEATTASPDSSSSETVVIIVVSVVGGLFAVGIVITISLMLLKRKKPGSKETHNYKENRNSWQFQRPKSRRLVGHSKHDNMFDVKPSGRHNSYPLRYIYPGPTGGEQFTGNRHDGRDRRANEVPNYYNPGSHRRQQYYIHPSDPHRSNHKTPTWETLHIDDQNYVAANYSMYW